MVGSPTWRTVVLAALLVLGPGNFHALSARDGVRAGSRRYGGARSAAERAAPRHPSAAEVAPVLSRKAVPPYYFRSGNSPAARDLAYEPIPPRASSLAQQKEVLAVKNGPRPANAVVRPGTGRVWEFMGLESQTPSDSPPPPNPVRPVAPKPALPAPAVDVEQAPPPPGVAVPAIEPAPAVLPRSDFAPPPPPGETVWAGPVASRRTFGPTHTRQPDYIASEAASREAAAAPWPYPFGWYAPYGYAPWGYRPLWSPWSFGGRSYGYAPWHGYPAMGGPGYVSPWVANPAGLPAAGLPGIGIPAPPWGGLLPGPLSPRLPTAPVW